MYPRGLLNWEKAFQVPAFEKFRELEPFAAWNGQLAVDVAVTKMLDGGLGELLSVDFSAFDQSVPFDVLRHVFGIMTTWFTRESKGIIAFLAGAFMHAGIYLPDGYYHGTYRTGGLPSGSGWTNWIGSIVNLWVWHYAVHRNSCGKGRVVAAQVNGDDGLYAFSGISSIADLSAILLRDLGMLVKMDPAKNLVSDSQVRFLQMEHSVNYRVKGLCVGCRPLNRILPKMTGMERRVPTKRLGLRDELPVRWKGVFNTYRWLQQMEPARHHPCFKQFMLWYYGQDRMLPEVMGAIARGDKEVSTACAMVGDEEEGSITLKSLRSSVVVAELTKLCGL
jgi:hypothetical protein